jgi:uncharacterized YigZ family protein
MGKGFEDMIIDEYLTVSKRATSELKVQRSLFIGTTAPIESEEAAKDFISQIQGKYKDATHNCYAYLVNTDSENVEYYSDAGEPSGSAGRPILNAIKSKNITNVVIVVTRYFGGKKLGIRGLIDAYGATALSVIEEAGIRKRVIEEEVYLTCDYKVLDKAMYYLSQHQGKVIESDYSDEVHLKVRVRKATLPTLTQTLASLGIKLE